MGITHSAPQYNATRRIKWLFFIVIAATIAFVAGWFIVANRIDAGITTALEERRALGEEMRCDNQEVRGFPFRFGLFCDSATYISGQTAAETGAIRSAAQFYNPNHIIVEFDGPMIARNGSDAVTINWDTARSSIVRGQPLPRRVSVEMKQPSINFEATPTLQAEALTAHMRNLLTADERGGDAGDLDVAAQITAPNILTLLNADAGTAPFNIDFDATFKQAAARFNAGERETLLANAAMTLHRAAIVLDDNSGVIIDGDVTTDQAGRLSGSLSVRVVDVDAVVAALSAAFPANAPMIAILTSLPRSGDNGDEATLTVTATDGQLSYGFIPLGTLPPLM